MSDHTTPQDVPLKVCTKCGEAKPVTEYSKNSHTKDKLHSYCKTCASAIYKAWREANAEKRRAYMKQWHADNLEYENRYAREKYQNDEQYRQHVLDWQKSHPEERRKQKMRRRARKLEAGGSHTAEDIKAQLHRQKGKCYYCHKKVGTDYHVDHIVPLSRGGQNDRDNIVIACSTCNQRKYNKLPHEWPEGGRLL